MMGQIGPVYNHERITSVLWIEVLPSDIYITHKYLFMSSQVNLHTRRTCSVDLLGLKDQVHWPSLVVSGHKAALFYKDSSPGLGRFF